MSDVLETYYLFSGSFDDAAKVRLYTALTKLPDVEASKSPATIEEELAKGYDVMPNFGYKSIRPSIIFTFDASGLPSLPRFLLHFETLTFEESLDGEEAAARRLDEAIEVMLRVYELAADVQEPPQYVIGADETDTEGIEVNHQTIRLTEEGIRSGRLENLFWLQIWSPDFVEKIGRDRIESASVSRIEWLDNGAVLLVAYDQPDYPTNYLDLHDHFGLEHP